MTGWQWITAALAVFIVLDAVAIWMMAG